ncbi:hypothetical protein chiPu_0013056 [Chiloscyllium punctatum]|uniref:Reverse transcriptase domain-containing protein n=1 Tax=Chiloscyllium punctatum TaxID=137246 RepID=A0A401SW23_CHIPU|nr:hypothetical protein [Chiloscyllium punctatum]
MQKSDVCWKIKQAARSKKKEADWHRDKMTDGEGQRFTKSERTTQEQYQLLKELSRLLKEFELKVNTIKADIMREEVNDIGVVLKKETDRQQIETAARLPVPLDVKALWSFFGLIGHCRDDIDAFVTKVARIMLLKRSAPWGWKPEHTRATTLNQGSVRASAHKSLNPLRPFPWKWLQYIAQFQQSCCKRSMVSQCDSLVLIPMEQGYVACERHSLALFWVVQHFSYIVGLNTLMEHAPIQRLRDGMVSQNRIARWMLRL